MNYLSEVEEWLNKANKDYTSVKIDEDLYNIQIGNSHRISLDTKYGFMGIYDSLTTWEETYTFPKDYIVGEITKHLDDYFRT